MGSKSDNIFIQKIETINRYIGGLYQSAQDVPCHQSQLMLDYLNSLIEAMEELCIAEEELRQQHEELMTVRQIAEIEKQRYQELFEFAPDGYLVTDIYGRIQEANCTAASLLHIAQKHLIGKLLIVFVPNESRCTFRSTLNQLPVINRVQEWELCLRGRENYEFDAAITVETVRDAQGKAIALRWLVRDISSRKQAEEQLHRTQLQNMQLIEAERLKNQFISTLSHELRTPMNAILGFSTLVQQRVHKQGDGDLLPMVERIFRNGKHLLTMIEDMLDFSRLQANRLVLKPDQFDLVELTATTAEELRVLADQKALEMQIHVEPKELVVFNDRIRVRQIITNLLSNAIKFTEAGSISLELFEEAPDHVVILVKDTGIGIAPIHQSQIFKEFWQVNQSISRQYGGTGLGLAITRALVEQMHGCITVESQLGAGTTFRVKFPRHVNVP